MTYILPPGEKFEPKEPEEPEAYYKFPKPSGKVELPKEGLPDWMSFYPFQIAGFLIAVSTVGKFFMENVQGFAVTRAFGALLASVIAGHFAGAFLEGVAEIIYSCWKELRK